MSTPSTVAFHTLGCKLNFSETSTIRRQFEDAGYGVVNFEEGADIYVLNTCSVTDFADKNAATKCAARSGMPPMQNHCHWLLCPTEAGRNFFYSRCRSGTWSCRKIQHPQIHR